MPCQFFTQLASADVEAMGFTELRDALLDLAPLDAKHVRLWKEGRTIPPAHLYIHRYIHSFI